MLEQWSRQYVRVRVLVVLVVESRVALRKMRRKADNGSKNCLGN